jgi:DNA-directed RNA polymerase specialized sigma subunit
MARTAAKFKLSAKQQKLVEDNLNLARREAWRYHRKTEIEYKTLESVAFEGLCQAAWRYDASILNDRTGEPLKFSSIAVPYTRGAILHYVRDRTYLLRLSHKMRENWLKGRKLLYKGYTDHQVADALDIDIIEWLETRVTCSGPPLELNEQGAPTIDAEIEEIDLRPHFLGLANRALRGLPDNEMARLESYFKGNGSKPQSDLLRQVYSLLDEHACPEVDFLSGVDGTMS